jgi:acetyltransferase-like isoleucine patch superfamily enzyme
MDYKMGILGMVSQFCRFKIFSESNILFKYYNLGISYKSEFKTDACSRIEFLGYANVGRYVLIDAYENCNIIIGNEVYLGDFSIIRGARCKIHIGEYSIIGQGVKMLATNHRYIDKALLVKNQDIDLSKNGISIGRDCWIGAGACILPGIEIGNGAIVGAMSVVTRNIDPYSVAVGNPAKQIKFRQ